MLLEVSPDIFGGIQLGSVGWQKEGFNLAVQASKVILHDTAAVSRQTIPDEQDAMADLFRQMLDKIAYFLLPYAPFVQSKIKLPQRDAGSDRQVIPIELMLQDRCDTALGPGADTMRSLAETALVYKDDDTALFLGFFLSAGQIFSCQSRMAASFRSRARPTGRWQLQPSL